MSAENSIIVKRYDQENTSRGVIHPDILARHCILDNGCHALELDYTTAPSLGLLSKLPVELQQQIILQMDTATVFSWRRVNKRAMDLVSNKFEWKEVISLAPSALRMIIGLRSQATFGLAELHNAFHYRTCVTQGCDPNTAQYINMKSLKRLCRSCFQYHARHIEFTIELALGYVELIDMDYLLGGQTGYIEEIDMDKLLGALNYRAEEKEESEDAKEEDNGLFKVAVTERMAFVYMGTL